MLLKDVSVWVGWPIYDKSLNDTLAEPRFAGLAWKKTKEICKQLKPVLHFIFIYIYMYTHKQ